MDLFEAARNGSLFLLKDLLASGQPINTTDQSGQTALMYAAREGHTDCVELLCQRGANVSIRTKKNGSSALCEAGNAACAEILVTFGANINHLDDWGQCSLSRAIEEGRIDVANLLLDKGASTGFADKKLRTPLHIAAWTGHVDICRRLVLEKSCDPLAQDSERRTPIDYSVSRGFVEIEEFLRNPGRLRARMPLARQRT